MSEQIIAVVGLVNSMVLSLLVWSADQLRRAMGDRFRTSEVITDRYETIIKMMMNSINEWTTAQRELTRVISDLSHHVQHLRKMPRDD